MVIEVAFFNIKEGLETDFENAFEQAGSIFSQVEGYRTHKIHKCIETQGRYMVQVEWENVESHMKGFVESPLIEEWNALVGHFFEPDVYMEHYQLLR